MGYLSGAYSPGLIEVSSASALVSVAALAYPGLIAPASLKLRAFWSRWRAAASGLSGAYSPGLIEVRAKNRRPPSVATVLSGAYSPGLIEVATPKPYRIQGSSYPGLIAPASLKFRRPSALPPGLGLLSGAYSPGLIEVIGTKMSLTSCFRLIRGL